MYSYHELSSSYYYNRDESDESDTNPSSRATLQSLIPTWEIIIAFSQTLCTYHPSFSCRWFIHVTPRLYSYSVFAKQKGQLVKDKNNAEDLPYCLDAESTTNYPRDANRTKNVKEKMVVTVKLSQYKTINNPCYTPPEDKIKSPNQGKQVKIILTHTAASKATEQSQPQIETTPNTHNTPQINRIPLSESVFMVYTRCKSCQRSDSAYLPQASKYQIYKWALQTVFYQFRTSLQATYSKNETVFRYHAKYLNIYYSHITRLTQMMTICYQYLAKKTKQMNDLKLKLTQKEKDPQSYSYFKKKFNDYENRIMVLEKTMKENCLEQKLYQLEKGVIKFFAYRLSQAMQYLNIFIETSQKRMQQIEIQFSNMLPSFRSIPKDYYSRLAELATTIAQLKQQQTYFNSQNPRTAELKILKTLLTRLEQDINSLKLRPKQLIDNTSNKRYSDLTFSLSKLEDFHGNSKVFCSMDDSQEQFFYQAKPLLASNVLTVPKFSNEEYEEFVYDSSDDETQYTRQTQAYTKYRRIETCQLPSETNKWVYKYHYRWTEKDSCYN